MDEIRKRAYAQLMHRAFTDIRNTSGSCHRWKWNLLKWPAWRRALKQNHFLADAFHNLPMYLTSECFDEAAFWTQLDRDSERCGWGDRYRKIFEQELSKIEPNS